MDTKKKTFHCKTTTEQELTGKKILQNCRNQLYLDFPYLDGAFTSLEYKADSSIDTIGTDGELIYFNPVFLMKKYLEDPAAVRRGYLHMLLRSQCGYEYCYSANTKGCTYPLRYFFIATNANIAQPAY